MMIYERGSVVLVPFPFSDQTTVKKRPAVVISSRLYNSKSRDIIIMAITSRTERVYPMGEYVINDWEQAGLLKPSAVKPAVATIEQGLVIKELGRLSVDDLIGLTRTISELLC